VPELKKHTHADRETGTHDARGLKIIQFIAGLNVCRRICGRGEIKNLTERSIEMGAELTSIFTNDSTRVPRHTHTYTRTHTPIEYSMEQPHGFSEGATGGST
jgi:hypothetical protein